MRQKMLLILMANLAAGHWDPLLVVRVNIDLGHFEIRVV